MRTRSEAFPLLCLLFLLTAQAVLGRLRPNLYRDPEWIEATWIGNDWVTLLVAVPLLGLGVVKSSTRARLLTLGVVAYAIYNYTFYLFGARLNAFFPLYVAAIWLSAACFISELRNLGYYPATSRPRQRLIGGYLVLVALMVSAVWFVFWAGYAFAGRPTPIEPEAFKVVAGLDLLLLVPPLLIGGSILWRGDAAGHLIASIAAVQGALYLFVLTVNSAIAIGMGLAVAPGELPMWAALAALTAMAAFRLLLSVRTERS